MKHFFSPCVAFSPLPKEIRLLGLWVLILLLWHHLENVKKGQAGATLWMCHLSNLLLGVGLLTERVFWIQVAILWLIPGLFLWACSVLEDRSSFSWSTCLSHFSGFGAGLYGLTYSPAPSYSVWWVAALWFLGVQQLCRVFTTSTLNVNIAYRMEPGWERLFSTYRGYWYFTTTMAILILWSVETLLYFLLPRTSV
jgi:hypothetical protein